jgi:hypothetical protein
MFYKCITVTVRPTLFSFLIFFSFSGSPVSSASASATGNLGAETIAESPFVTTDTPVVVVVVVVVVVTVAVQAAGVKAVPLPPPVFPPSCSFFAFFASRFFFCFKAAFEGFAKIKYQ